jgi:hypothetical protein
MPDRHHVNEPEGRVVQFRPRRERRGLARSFLSNAHRTPVEDLSKYERRGEDDYRHRMIVNAFAFVATILLIGTAVWLADAMADLRRKDECLLQHRRNCNPIALPRHERYQRY